MTINEWLIWGTEQLKDVTDIPRKEAEILFAHDLGWERIRLHTRLNEICQPTDYCEFIRRRATYEPLEYITEEVSFYGETFAICSGVLIPRPETELLIEKTLPLIPQNARILDVGCGSGVIGIMCAKLRPDITVHACDINPLARELSAKNGEKLGVRVKIFASDLLRNVNENYDAVLSNPPYIAQEYPLEKNVLFEPANALFGGEKGDELLIRLIEECRERRIPLLACETGYDQRDSMREVLIQNGYTHTEFFDDYSGFHRGFIASGEFLKS